MAELGQVESRLDGVPTGSPPGSARQILLRVPNLGSILAFLSTTCATRFCSCSSCSLRHLAARPAKPGPTDPALKELLGRHSRRDLRTRSPRHPGSTGECATAGSEPCVPRVRDPRPCRPGGARTARASCEPLAAWLRRERHHGSEVLVSASRRACRDCRGHSRPGGLLPVLAGRRPTTAAATPSARDATS